MNNNIQTPDPITLSQETLNRYQKQAEEHLISSQNQLKPITDESLSNAENAKTYIFGGSFTIAGFGYLQLSSVTPLEFTNGTKLTYLGKGGGVVIGGGIFAGAGSFSRNPADLPNYEIAFTAAASPGVGDLVITWWHNGNIIGVFYGKGISAFIGGGGGSGWFKRA